MAYIGKAPNTAIVNQATSQSFSGNGSTTAFTLNRSVNVGEDLEVFVNNVQQEPGSGKSYTASGTTLTFDEAPPSGTGNVYVIYRGEATINPRLEHDANAALAATTGTFTGAFTSPGIDDNASATAITIDSSGRVGIGATNMDESLLIQQTASGANTDVTIRSANDGNSRINFGDQSSDGSGRIDYDHTSNYMAVTTNASERLRIDTNGSVGIGTASPSYPMELASSSGAGTQFGITYVPNSVTLLLRAGGADANIGTVGSHPLLLKTGNTERMRINSNGTIISQNVGSTSANLEINGASTNGHYNILMNGDSGNGYKVAFKHGSSVVGTIITTSSNTAYNTSSDYRLKQGVEDMTGAIDRVKALAPKRFQFIADADTTVDGFLAHEAQAVVPESVTGTKDEVDEDGNAVMQGIDQSKLVPLLTAALKESIAKIETLEAKVAALEGN